MSPAEAEIARLYRRVRDEPRSTAFVGLGDALRRAGRHGEGLRVLREGFRVHPDHPAARVVLARIHLEMGNRALATEVLVEVVRTDPENLAAAALLARLYVEEGRPREARPLVERLRQANHPDAAHRDLAAALAPDEAPEEDTGLPQSDDPFDRPDVAARLAGAGHYHRAWALWSRLAAASPHSQLVRERLGALERHLGGQGDAPGEPPLPGTGRRALPGLTDVVQALQDDEQDRAPPGGAHPVARWGRALWRAL